MKKMLIAVAAGLMTLSALPATAGVVGQERPYMQNNGPMNGPMNHGPVARPGPDGQYGTWDDRWGRRPNAPPRGWNNRRHNDWYRHVRACSQRYRSYNPSTDMFVVRHNGRRAIMATCRL